MNLYTAEQVLLVLLKYFRISLLDTWMCRILDADAGDSLYLLSEQLGLRCDETLR